MLGRILVSAGVLVGGLVAVPAGSSSASTAQPNIVGTGITTCPVYGTKLKFNPPILTVGTATLEKVTLVVTGKPCTGGSPTPKSFTLKAHATISGTAVNDCSDFFSPTPPGGTVTVTAAFSGTITWIGAVAIAASPVTFGALTSTDTPTGTAPITFNVSPITVTVSYPTTTGSLAFQTTATAGVVNGAADCGSTGGVSVLRIGNPGSGTF